MEWHHTTTDDMVELERIRQGSSRIGVGELGSHLLEWQLPAGSDPVEELCDQAPALKNFREAVRSTGNWASMSAHLRSTLEPYLRSSAAGPVATSEYILHVGTVPNSDTALFRTRG